MVTIFTPSIQSITGDTTSAALALSAATEDRDGQAEPMKLTDQESRASITSITSITSTTRSGSTIEIRMMMMTIMKMTMIEIKTGLMIEIKMRLRQTFDDKTEEIQARDHSPAWISR